MNDLQKIIRRARNSPFYLWLLNRILWRAIPFNSPHRLKLVSISDNSVRIKLPYKRKNLNHIKGLHACALATLAEFTTGLTIIYLLGTARFRIIMKKIEMEYEFQGKENAYAEFELSDEWIQSKIVEVIEKDGAVVQAFEVEVFDESRNKLCTGRVHWQIKEWSKVQTQV